MKANSVDTSQQIVALAQARIQTDGFAGMHYGEIAKTLGITRAAVHHYFPSKTDLVRRVISDYCREAGAQLALISQSPKGDQERFADYTNLYRVIIAEDDQRVCPGGMLASEVVTLPADIRSEVQNFFSLHIGWVQEFLVSTGRVKPGTARAEATRIVSTLQGALLVARLYGNVAEFDDIVSRLADQLDLLASS